MQGGFRLRCVIALAWLAGACGGATKQAPGSVHTGKGVYALTIERRGDNCDPPMATGAAGEVVVFVATGGGAEGTATSANIPLGGAQDGFAAARSDVSLDEARTFSLAENASCADATETISITPLAADASHIDVEWTDSRRNPCDPSFDCTSDRVLHFRWLRACSPDDHSLEKCP